MGQMRRDRDLAQKARGAQLAHEVGAQHLERDEPVMLAVAREIHGRHAAATELALDLVAVGKGGAERIGDDVRHGRQLGGEGRSR